MPLRSLRARILAISSALIVGLSAATLAYVGTLASRAVGDRIAADLLRSRDLVAAAENERYRELALVAQLVASFPELRALFATDIATIRDFLGEYRQRQGRSELLVALDPLGRVLARTDTFAALAIPEVEQTLLQPARDGREARGVLEIDGRPYQVAAAPAEAGGTIFGFVLAASPIDDEWARALRNVSGDEIVALTPRGVAGSTLPPDRLPWRSMNELGQITEDMSEAVTVGGERFTVIAAPGADDAPLRILALQSRDLALAPYRRHPARPDAARAGRRRDRHRRQRAARPFDDRADQRRSSAATAPGRGGQLRRASAGTRADEIGAARDVVQPDDRGPARARRHAEVRLAVDGRR